MVKQPNSLLRLAEKDMEASMLILTSSNDELLQNIAAYHTQQSVEKILISVVSMLAEPNDESI